MHVSVRQYRTKDVAEAVRRVEEGFLPIIGEVTGLVAYYVVDPGDGTLMSITVAQNQAGVDDSVARAGEWVKENIADLIEGNPTVTSGEVVAQV